MRSRPLGAALAALAIVVTIVPAHALDKQRKGKKDEKPPAAAKSTKSGKPTPWNEDRVAAASAHDGGPQRIEFGPGTMSASLIGQVARSESRTYLLAWLLT